MAPFSESRNFRGWWISKTPLEQKLIILSSILFILSFCLTISVIVLDNRKAPSCGGSTTVDPGTDTEPATVTETTITTNVNNAEVDTEPIPVTEDDDAKEKEKAEEKTNKTLKDIPLEEPIPETKDDDAKEPKEAEEKTNKTLTDIPLETEPSSRQV